MARFKTLRKKEKRYIFDFLANKGDDHPAVAVFARFPLSDEDFMTRPKTEVFDGIDLEKLGKGDRGEKDKLLFAFLEHIRASVGNVDYDYFSRECIDHFEDFEFDGKEIKTVDDFLSLPVEMRTLIANNCYKYAMKKDEFAMGESDPS